MKSIFSFPMFPFAIFAAAGFPAVAQPTADVSQKLDSIILFAPIDEVSPNSPKALEFELNGQSRSVYFAAFSPSAVQQLIKQRLMPQKLKNVKNLKFGAFSLSKFDALVQPIIESNTNSRVVYIPDPVQIPFAEDLLVKQGTSLLDAQKVTKTLPFIFCPNPAIKATPNSGPLKGESFIPCSTDFNSVKAMIDKGIATNPKLKKSALGVVALPITNFASMLAKANQDDFNEIRILPNPANVQVIRDLKK